MNLKYPGSTPTACSMSCAPRWMISGHCSRRSSAEFAARSERRLIGEASVGVLLIALLALLPDPGHLGRLLEDALQHRIHQGHDLISVLDLELLRYQVAVRGLVTSKPDLVRGLAHRLADVPGCVERVDLSFQAAPRNSLVLRHGFKHGPGQRH